MRLYSITALLVGESPLGILILISRFGLLQVYEQSTISLFIVRRPRGSVASLGRRLPELTDRHLEPLPS